MLAKKALYLLSPPPVHFAAVILETRSHELFARARFKPQYSHLSLPTRFTGISHWLLAYSSLLFQVFVHTALSYLFTELR
jgi:hypothetical protein